MPRAITLAALPSMMANSTGEEWILLLTLSHPEWPVTKRMAKRRTAINSRGNTYFPVHFSPKLPDQIEGELQPWQVTIDNTDLTILSELMVVNSRPDIVVELIRASAPDVIEMTSGEGYKVYSYSHVQADLSLEISMHNLIGEGYPGGQILPSNFPGGF